MGKPLVIVESPAKARTIAGYLGNDYIVESSVGHIRDLPRSAADVPKTYKGESWARLGVDTDNDFKPLYVVTGRAKEQVRRLKALLKEADELYLATDEDREGEAIAWHLQEVLSPRVPVKRMVFHEITPRAIRDAIENPRDLDRRLVDAQEARRILDRLYGYEVSPVLWKKVMPRLSAGRVQSVAVRLIVERERERMAFVSAEYWGVEGSFRRGSDRPFGASLVALDGARLATGKDFDRRGQARDGVVVLDRPGATGLVEDLQGRSLEVSSVDSKPYRRRPAAPFMTSTLQQEAGRKLGFSSSRTMRAAQRLYESGYITYMRTDSTTLSGEAISAARKLIAGRFGSENMPDSPRRYSRKVKNAQEAHEAIRPAGTTWKSPDQVAAEVQGDAARVYDLIWRRTVASQMIDATGRTVTIRLVGDTSGGHRVEFSTSGTVITTPGFRLAYVEGEDQPDGDGQQLPDLAEGDRVDIEGLEPKGHETTPPSRYTEASLVKKLEELGVGRPSTYASIIETIQDRGYVWKKGSALVPAFTAFATVTLLEQHFPHLVDYAFTAEMEDDLDQIAAGDREAVPWLRDFYFGPSGPGEGEGTGNGDTDHRGLKYMVSEQLGEIDARQINSIPIGVDAEGTPVVVRVGRYGPYVQRGDDKAGIPDDIAPDELTIDRAVELLEAPSGDRVLGVDPETGVEVVARAGRFGPYVTLGMPSDDNPKPKTASLFKDMDLETVSLEDALKLLSLPRVVGSDDEGVEITVQNGRYGPYLKRGKDTRSLESEDQLFTLDREGALALLAQPKRGRGAVAKPPLRELGPDPVSGGQILLKDGRFGPYVTDGEVNASLRKDDDPETITPERAAELIQLRRERGPVKKKARKKKAPAKKKATAKKSAARKKAPAKKKATAKKSATRKKAPAGE